MKAMLYLDQVEEPLSVLDDVSVVEFDTQNHPQNGQVRLFYRTSSLNATRKMVELQRDRKMIVKLEDGRKAHALLAHSSMDGEGNAVGVFRVLGPFF